VWDNPAHYQIDSSTKAAQTTPLFPLKTLTFAHLKKEEFST
jgi:hypothetical protein